MDCRTARTFLNCLQPDSLSTGAEGGDKPDRSESAASTELLDHLDQCPACRQLLEEWRHLDHRLSAMLISSPVPSGLEDRLLSAVENEISRLEPAPASSVSAASGPQSRRKRRRLWTTLAATAGLLILGAVWWTRPGTDELLSYHGAGQLLASHFLNADDAWEHLDQFDGNFDLGTYQMDLGLFELSPAHGIDLGGGRSQDAAVFEFGLKNWKGIITVLPSQHFTGLPDVGTSNVMAGHTVLQWRSSDGKLTYLCFVHRGSAAALAQELFGLLT